MGLYRTLDFAFLSHARLEVLHRSARLSGTRLSWVFIFGIAAPFLSPEDEELHSESVASEPNEDRFETIDLV
jgi:hypothetical protein